MNEELQQLLEGLHLTKILEILEEEQSNAEKQQPTYSEFLLRLLRAQWHFR